MDFGVHGNISLSAEFRAARAFSSQVRVVDVLSIKSLKPPNFDEDDPLEPYVRDLTLDFIDLRGSSYLMDARSILFKSVIYLKSLDQPYIEVDVPYPALIHAIRSAGYDAEWDAQARLDPGSVPQDWVLSLTPNGIKKMEADYQNRDGLFKTYDYYVSPFTSVEMKSPAQMYGIEELYPDFD